MIVMMVQMVSISIETWVGIVEIDAITNENCVQVLLVATVMVMVICGGKCIPLDTMFLVFCELLLNVC